MSDYDLRVLTDHLHELAAQQRSVAGSIAIATGAAGSLSSRMWSSHGTACAATNIAASNAEEVRLAGGTNLSKVATKLAENLDYGAANYANTDFEEGEGIGACSV